MRGRQYRAEAEITCTTAGTLPDDARDALTTAIARGLGSDAPGLSWSVSPGPYSRLKLTVTLTADRPLTALTRLDAALDDSLIATGLFEEFDVTGRVLQVAPAEQPWRAAP
jgi:hypothetical protein